MFILKFSQVADMRKKSVFYEKNFRKIDNCEVCGQSFALMYQ